MGSITGGGRYDNLTGIFGLPGLSGVGISFGADRIYDVLNALDLYPKEAVNSTQVLSSILARPRLHTVCPSWASFARQESVQKSSPTRRR